MDPYQGQQGQMETVTETGPDGYPQTQPAATTTGKYIPPQDLFMEIWTNKTLRIPKAFYFFFFAAFGSLFPLMAVYFKQLGMSSIQAGILIGIRPFIEIFSAPFWSGLADRFRKGKIMIMASLACWIIFTCAMAYIRPPATACVIFNATHYVMYTPYSDQTDEWYEEAVVEKTTPVPPKAPVGNPITAGKKKPKKTRRFAIDEGDLLKEVSEEELSSTEGIIGYIRGEDGQLEAVKKRIKRAEKKKKQSFFDSISPIFRFKPPPGHIIGKSPTTIEYVLNYNKDKHASYVSPPSSTVVYKWEDVKEVFFLLLLLVLLGEFFSAPAVTLADSATLSVLGENTELYGRQRMFGSVGWAISMFLVGMALDRSVEFSNHPCGPHERERNYKVCFAYFAVLMALALAVASRFDFGYDDQPYEGHEDIQLNPFAGKKDQIPGPRPIFNPAPPINPPPDVFNKDSKRFEFIDKWKSAVFAQRQRKLPDWLTVLKACSNVRYGSFLFVVWFMGLGTGLIFSFLFWHLQDLGGTPTLFGVASVINHISEIIAFFHSFRLIKELGHTRVICLGLACNVGRYLYISWISNPWWVLPFELIQGITHATVWAACCSYITSATAADTHLKQSTQGVLQGLHHGLGRGMGAIIGGSFINLFGTRATFFFYAFLSVFVLGFYVYVNYQQTENGRQWIEDLENMNIVLDENVGLAPHGVPSAPIAHAAAAGGFDTSNQQQMQQDVYDPLSQVNSQWGSGGYGVNGTRGNIQENPLANQW